MEAARARVSKPLNAPIPIDWLEGDYYERKDNLNALVHHWFFSGVHLSLCMEAEGQPTFEFVRAPSYKDRENISHFLDALSVIAAQVAKRWWRGEFVDFHELFELLKPVEFRSFRQDFDASSAAKDFRAGLHRVACDIRLGSCLLAHLDEVDVTAATMAAAGACEWFDSASFRAQYAAGLLARMSDAAAEAFVHSQRILLDAEIRQETSVHLQTPLQLCGIALGHGLRASARELCNQTWELTTGYGHRKDPTLNNTVDAIDYLVEVAADDARRLLSLISPQIHHVLDYTDGKGTRHVLAAADHLLAKLCPAALVVKYEEHTHAGDWSHAEDSLRAYVEQAVRDGWPLDALMRTGCTQRFRMRWRGLNMQGRRVPQSGCVFLKSMLGGTLACCSVQMRPAIATASHIPATLRCMRRSSSTTCWQVCRRPATTKKRSCFEPGMSTGIELGRADVCSPRWTDCCSQTKGAARASSNCLTLLLRPGAN